MEPPAKRQRLSGDTRGDAAQSAEDLQCYHNSFQPSNTFEGYGVQNTGNLKVSRDFIMNINERSNTNAKVDKRQELLESLQFDQMDARQLTIKKAHARTCAWFLNTSPYIDWTKKNTMRDDRNFLWIKGKPGAGKSTLMKFLLGELRKQTRQAGNQEVLLSFFFNARGNDLEKTTTGLYRSLLLQLLEARPDLGYVLDSIRIGHLWTTGSLKSLFEEALQGLGDTSLICLIDALDECEEAQIRDMVSFLSDPGVIPNRFRICFASRHYPHITIKTGLSIVLETQIGHSKDIESYLHSALIIKDNILAEQIRCDLQEKASGVFMWVVLVVDILNKEYDAGREHVLRARIKQIPGDLHKLFLDILTRDNNNMNGLLLCIQWVLFAQQPLTPRQLYFAILSELEPEKLSYCHSENISEDNIKRYILSNSKGLAEPTRSKIPTIQFIHESVRDFLLKEKGLSRIRPDLSTNVFGLSHNMLKKCCKKYMSMKEVTDIEGSSREKVTREFPFLGYAHQGILFHADQAQSYNICQQEFLATFPRCEWVKHHNIFSKKRVRLYTPKVSLFYILAETGMAALIRAQPTRQSCFEVEGERYGLPVLAASATKSSEAIQTMLELEAKRLSDTSLEKLNSVMPPNLDISYASGRNFKFTKRRDLLHQLVEYGNEKASLFFLGVEGCDIHAKNSQGTPILVTAVEKGFDVLVEALLHVGADASVTCSDHVTALQVALSRGYIRISKLLIDYGADVSANGGDLGSPLLIAASHNHVEIFKLLIDSGANVSTTNQNGRSLLHSAAFNNHVEIVKLFIDGGANVSTIDLSGPLHSAASKNHVEIVKLLIDGGANFSTTDLSGPLYSAASKNYVKIVKLLIDGGANFSTTDLSGPLHSAAFYNHVEIFKLLINSGANVLTTDLSGLLHSAASKNHIEIAKLLIDHGANPSINSPNGSSLLLEAIKHGQIGIAKLLIESGADVSVVDDYGRTALDLTLGDVGGTGRYYEVVEMLLKRGARG
ncbi:hypothetical protein F4782DRAFT_345485 [Xylaria castorea]|nr:hypothetical protein F4782DRAFT_345485 [Xylaria castorea]